MRKVWWPTKKSSVAHLLRNTVLLKGQRKTIVAKVVHKMLAKYPIRSKEIHKNVSVKVVYFDIFFSSPQKIKLCFFSQIKRAETGFLDFLHRNQNELKEIYFFGRGVPCLTF